MHARIIARANQSPRGSSSSPGADDTKRKLEKSVQMSMWCHQICTIMKTVIIKNKYNTLEIQFTESNSNVVKATQWIRTNMQAKEASQ